MPAATVTVPTFFTAVDRFTSVVANMQNRAATFAGKLQGSLGRANRWFNKLTPTLNQTQKQLFSIASAASIAAAVLSTANFGVKSIMDYETALHSLEAVTGESSAKFKSSIESIAKRTRMSAIDVAGSFEVIGSAMSQYLKNPKALGMIADAGITLAKASRQELTPTLDNLTNIMNQFKLGADQAFYAVNRLSAGEIVGSMRTSEVASALQEFGAGAKLANISLGESVALVEVLGAQMNHAMVGNAAKNLTLILSSAKGLSARARKELTKDGVNMNTLMSRSIPLSARLKELSKILKDPVAMVKVFGRENLTAGQIILSNLSKYKQWTSGVNKTNQAQHQAAVNSATVATALTQLKNSFVNTLVSGNQLNGTMGALKTLLVFIADHMGTILAVGLTIIGMFAAWKIAMTLCAVALGAYNIAIGVAGALTGICSTAIGASTIALNAYKIAMAISTAATWLFNAALAANPIVWIAAAIIAGVLAIVYIFTYWDEITKWFVNQWHIACHQVTAIWDSVVGFFSKLTLKSVFIAIGKAIMDFVLAPLTAVLKLASYLPGRVGDNAATALSKINDMSTNLFVQHDVAENKPALPSPQQKQNQVNQQISQSNQLSINLNDPGNNIKSTQMSGPLNVPIKITPTHGVLNQ